MIEEKSGISFEMLFASIDSSPRENLVNFTLSFSKAVYFLLQMHFASQLYWINGNSIL